MYQVFVVEDTPADAERICSLVKAFGILPEQITVMQTMGEFYRRSEALKPDIALLDIELADGTGIEIAQELNRKNPHCQIIFLSNHLFYALDVYRTEHIFFITKADMHTYLPEALEKAVRKLNQLQQAALVFKQGHETVHIQQADILYLERNGRTTTIYCETESFYTAEKLTVLLERLSPVWFCQCHRSYAVNFLHMRQFQGGALLLESGGELPLGRKFAKTTKEQFAAFICGR